MLVDGGRRHLISYLAHEEVRLSREGLLVVYAVWLESFQVPPREPARRLPSRSRRRRSQGLLGSQCRYSSPQLS